jgi:hypothetical protein
LNEPQRLLEESSDDLERALLRAGTSFGASAALRDKTLSALGLGVAAGGATVSGAAALASNGAGAKAGGLLSWLSFKAMGAMVGVAIAVGAPVLYFSEDEPAAVARLVPSRKLKVSPAPVVVVPSPRSTASASAAIPPTKGAPPKLAPAEALRSELMQLDAARTRLARGRPEDALKVLDAYERATPRGRLKLEAEVLRIDALSQMGRRAQARQRARAFLARYPDSVLAGRVRRIAGH